MFFPLKTLLVLGVAATQVSAHVKFTVDAASDKAATRNDVTSAGACDVAKALAGSTVTTDASGSSCSSFPHISFARLTFFSSLLRWIHRSRQMVQPRNGRSDVSTSLSLRRDLSSPLNVLYPPRTVPSNPLPLTSTLTENRSLGRSPLFQEELRTKLSLLGLTIVIFTVSSLANRLFFFLSKI